MKFLLKSASFLFHPLWIPLAGSCFYFLFTPRFFPEGVVKAKLLAITILTIFIPIVFYFLLKNLGKADSVFLENVRERKWPLFFFGILMMMLLNQIINVYDYAALYYYYIGILISTFLALILVLFRFKASLHMMGLGGLVSFLIVLSVEFQINLIYTISFFILGLGLTASSRIYYKAHSVTELLIGLFIGICPQFLWLYLQNWL
jgi:hypothetical protein